MDDEEHFGVAEVVAASSGLATLGGLVWTLVEPSIPSYAVTVAGLLLYTAARQVSIHGGRHSDDEPPPEHHPY